MLYWRSFDVLKLEFDAFEDAGMRNKIVGRQRKMLDFKNALFESLQVKIVGEFVNELLR